MRATIWAVSVSPASAAPPARSSRAAPRRTLSTPVVLPGVILASAGSPTNLPQAIGEPGGVFYNPSHGAIPTYLPWREDRRRTPVDCLPARGLRQDAGHFLFQGPGRRSPIGALPRR